MIFLAWRLFVQGRRLSFYRGVFLRVSHWVNRRQTRRGYVPIGFAAASIGNCSCVALINYIPVAMRLRVLRLFTQRLCDLGSGVKVFGGGV